MDKTCTAMICDPNVYGMGYAPEPEYFEIEEEMPKCVECLEEFSPDEIHETPEGLMCDMHFQCYKEECIEMCTEYD